MHTDQVLAQIDHHIGVLLWIRNDPDLAQCKIKSFRDGTFILSRDKWGERWAYLRNGHGEAIVKARGLLGLPPNFEVSRNEFSSPKKKEGYALLETIAQPLPRQMPTAPEPEAQPIAKGIEAKETRKRGGSEKGRRNERTNRRLDFYDQHLSTGKSHDDAIKLAALGMLQGRASNKRKEEASIKRAVKTRRKAGK